jgi:hypothetical protein
MNKKESGAAVTCNRTSTSVVRDLSVPPQAARRAKPACPIATQSVQPSQRFIRNNHDRVGKRLTLVGISVNGSGVYPLDGLLLGDGLNAKKRDLT